MDGFGEVLDRYGQRVVVCYGDGRSELDARAFFQPVAERREDWRQQTPTPLGIVRRDRFLYLGEPGVSLEGCEVLVWQGQRFRPRSIQSIYVGEAVSHWWAVAEAEEEA